MIHRVVSRFWLLVLSGALTLPFSVNFALAEKTDSTSTEKPIHIVPVTPGPLDGKIAWVTASLLEQSHYSRQRFDQAMSSRFLDHYIEALDPQHLHFLQSDLAEFEKFRTVLGDMTIARKDATPASVVFNRFIERLQQRVTYVDELLKTEKFAFDTDERITINRKEQPYPRDLNEAKALWKQRLRFEYLQERLGKLDAKKKAAKEKPSDKDADKKDAPKPKTEAEDIVETLHHSYHRSLRNFTDWNNDDVLQVYLDTLAHLYDPHSDYMGAQHLDSFSISMNLSLSGIGAELMTSPDGYCTINRLLPGGPAANSKKVKEKDRIVAVAQGDKPPVDVVDMNLNKVVQMIRGPKGTEVRLTILPPGASSSATSVITLIRDDIKLEDQAAKAKIIELPNGQGENLRLGVIDLPSFYAQFDFGGPKHGESDPAVGGKSTSADVARLLKKLKAENVGGIILDLRRNGGGSLEEAVKLTGLFIKEGPVVQVRNFQGTIEEEDDTDSSVLYDGPLIVLTSRFSASASEILAGALQDYGRALVVGDSSTHGKGTVQSVNPLRTYLNVPAALMTNDPGALKLTIKKFYRASGASTQLKGVTPDIVLPSVVNESKDFGEAALDNPLPWDTISSAKYEHLPMVDPYLPDLRKSSSERVAKEKEYDYVREDIALYKKRQADKTISLNEKERIKEKDEDEARLKARDKERLARKEPQEKVYELTLRLADQPGLPAPVQKTNTVAKVSGANGAAAATNSASVSATPGDRDVLTDDEADDEKAPAVDASLQETEHILVDYMGLVRKQALVTAGHASN
jgi:carboxyl-terminal processing protease